MQIETIKSGDREMTISVRGEMDAQGCSLIRDDIERIADNAGDRAVVIDISKVNFLDSSGIGAIVYLYKRIKSKGGSLSISNASGQPLELMELLRINTAIPVQSANHFQEAR
ncbi:anti-anti-sigma factor [Bacterioplanes sanyensis]|uniref:Anti-sigma factor antagonist n=2 Tax=Bacterioplanes sanyensis TaxID=1249553 RepID=A0A222FM43_9GAMM|nr:anti-anti-sigma factor [Bacterioplanes sanyensis]